MCWQNWPIFPYFLTFYRPNSSFNWQDKRQMVWLLLKTTSHLFQITFVKRGIDGGDSKVRTGSTGCEDMECIIANQVTRLSLTFNLPAVNIPPANSCLFKPRPAQPPQPWRSAVKLHLIFDKWLSTEYPFIVSSAGRNYDLLVIILIIIFIVKLGLTVERTRSLNLIKHLLILVPGSTKTLEVDLHKQPERNRISLKQSSANVAYLPGV